MEASVAVVSLRYGIKLIVLVVYYELELYATRRTHNIIMFFYIAREYDYVLKQLVVNRHQSSNT